MADKKLNVNIITPLQVIFSGEADIVNVPGAKSPFEVLINHAPIVSSLEHGIIKISDRKAGTSKFISSEGFIEVSNNNVAILVENAVDMSNLSIDTIEHNIEMINSKLTNPEINEAEQHALMKELTFEKFRKKTLLSQN